jgi:hypothetical protein
MSCEVCFAAWMPAIRAVAKTFPFAILFSEINASVSGRSAIRPAAVRLARAHRLRRDIDHLCAAIRSDM